MCSTKTSVKIRAFVNGPYQNHKVDQNPNVNDHRQGTWDLGQYRGVVSTNVNIGYFCRNGHS